MQRFIARLPVQWQFTTLAILGIILTLAGMGLALEHSRDLAYEAKRAEIQHEAEAGASIVRFFVEREQSGALSHAEALKRATEAVGAIRFQGVNYIALLGFDGVSLANANTAMIGKNVMDLKDPFGNPVTRAQLDVATSSKPGFVEFYWKKIGETAPKLKMSYNIGIPEWQMDVTTGDFVEDLDAMLIDSVVRLAEIFTPLLLGFIVVAALMRRSFGHLLGSLVGAMRALMQGKLETEVARRATRDEIGEMAEALIWFRKAAIDKAALEQQALQQRQIIETERRSSDQASAEMQSRQQAVVAALGAELERLSRGDLTGQLNQAFTADYEKLRADFNATAASLREAMRTIAEATAGIDQGSDQIAAASDTLSRRTEQQAASLEETAAALNLLTNTVNTMASHAGEAASVVATTRGAAERSGDIVRQAVDAMGKIKQSSERIATIITVIDEIAFQTNLLALNAGVEAARAGEAGRGFAVVASEVRALAQRSAEAAKEIKNLISASTNQVEAGVALVDRTGQALQDIIEKVAAMDTLVGEISASSKEQATGLAEINMAVGEMDQVVQQNAAMAEQSTAAAHTLRAETVDLATLVRRFDIGTSKRADARSSAAARQNPVHADQQRLAAAMRRAH